MIDYVTPEEAQRWREKADDPLHGYQFVERLAATVVCQAELLAEAREALQQIARPLGLVIRRDNWPLEVVRLRRIASAALARLDTQEAKP